MTTPIERRDAIAWTREFLVALCNPQKTPRVPQKVRRMAGQLLRHYPSGTEVDAGLVGKRTGAMETDGAGLHDAIVHAMNEEWNLE